MTLRNIHRIIGFFPFTAVHTKTGSIVTFTERANVTGEYIKAENGGVYASDQNEWEIVTTEHLAT